MKSEYDLSQVRERLGEPVATMGEKHGSDLRNLYPANPNTSVEVPSVYEEKSKGFYGGVFGNVRINDAHTIVDFLVSAETELVRNAAEHGNRGRPEKRITVTRSFYRDYALIEVNHDGEGFDYDTVIDKDEELIVEAGDVESAKLLTSRGTGRLHQATSTSEGGQGLKRLIADTYGDFGYNNGGKTAFYLLPYPKGVKIDASKIKKLL